MKLTASFILLFCTAPILAQTTSSPAKPATTAAKPATTTTAHKPAGSMPVVPGVPHMLYSLRYIDTKIGTGPLVDASKPKIFTVHYTGWLAADGKKFDSSVDRGQPISFAYGAHRVIPGWDTGFQGMHVGGKRRLFIPYQLAYGELGRPPVIPAKANLIFDVELVGMADPPPTPPAAPAKPVAPPTGSTPPTAAQPATPPSTPASTPAPAAQPTAPPHPEK